MRIPNNYSSTRSLTRPLVRSEIDRGAQHDRVCRVHRRTHRSPSASRSTGSRSLCHALSGCVGLGLAGGTLCAPPSQIKPHPHRDGLMAMSGTSKLSNQGAQISSAAACSLSSLQRSVSKRAVPLHRIHERQIKLPLCLRRQVAEKSLQRARHHLLACWWQISSRLVERRLRSEHLC
jgi:hypothetical protein